MVGLYFSCNMSTLSTTSFTVIKSGLELTYKLVRHMYSNIVKIRTRGGGVFEVKSNSRETPIHAMT